VIWQRRLLRGRAFRASRGAFVDSFIGVRCIRAWATELRHARAGFKKHNDLQASAAGLSPQAALSRLRSSEITQL
jgi:hypothetical protein